MRSSLVGVVFYVIFLAFSNETFAQPAWDAGFPALRQEARSIGLRVNLNEKATVYYVVYRTAAFDPGPGALTPAQIKGNSFGSEFASGSFVFGDDSYCRIVPPGCSNVDGDVTNQRVVSIALNNAGSYRIYFTAESITTPGSLTPAEDRVTSVFGTSRCFKVGSTTQGPDAGKNLVSTTGRCSPSSYILEVFYTGVDYRASDAIEAFVNFGDDGAAATAYPLAQQASPLGTFEHNKEFRRYYAQINKTYDYDLGDDPNLNAPGSGCTFHIDINLGACTGVNTEQDLDATVWDDPGTSKGIQDVNPDGPDATDEEYEQCEGDRTAIDLVDASQFNCVAVEEVRDALGLANVPNYEARWVQWVYGVAGSDVTTGGSSTEKITINGVDFDLADFPIYGPVEYQAAQTDAAFSVAYPIQMPMTATPGQTFIVEMRSWNTCRAYDLDVSDANGLNPSGGVFDVGDNNDAKWFGATGTYPGNGAQFGDASETPVVFTKEIVIIDAPDPPIIPGRDVCATANGSNADQLSVTAPLAGFTYRWYSDASLATEITTGTTFNPDNTQAPNGERTHFWVIVESAGTGNCRSQPTEVTLTKRSTLNQPPVITVFGIAGNPNDLCPNSSYTFTVTTAPADVTITDDVDGDFTISTNYLWSFPAGWTNIVGDGTATVTATSPVAAAAAANISVVRRYDDGTSTPPAASFCNSTARNYSVTVRAAPVASILPDPALVCEADQLQLDGNPTLAFGTITNHSWTVDNSILNDPTLEQPTVEVGTTPGTYDLTYTVTAVFDPGVLCSGSDDIQVTVNPTPPKPTITPDNPTTFCFGDDVTLSSSNVLATSYQWYKDGVAIAGATGQTHLINTVAQSGSYSVRTIGIAATDCNSPESDPVTVTVHPLPTAENPTGGGAVCGANPAPDIEWVLTGTAPFDLIYSENGVPVVVNDHPTNTFTILAPGPGVNTDYQITSLVDDNGCAATSTGGIASVILGGFPPAFDVLPSLTTADVCDNGGATSDPILQFSMDNNSASLNDFELRYRIDGGAIRTKNFNSDAAGDPTGLDAPITFSDAELDNIGPHTVRVVSILSDIGCQSIFNTDLTFTVNARPSDPTNPTEGIACSADATGAMISVDDPLASNLILWFEDVTLLIPAVGTTGGSNGETFIPNSNITHTYYAVTQSQTVPTLCLSVNPIAVQHTQDVPPTAAADFPNFNTCDEIAVLTATPADNGGSGLWTAGTPDYYETFPSVNNGLGLTGPSGAATFNYPSGEWNVSVPGGALTDNSDWIRVESGRIVARDVNLQEVVWESRIMNLTSSVDITADIAETGNQAGTDYIRVSYEINGVPTEFGSIVGDGTDATLQTFTAAGIGAAGNALKIIMRARNNGASDEHWLDNVVVTTAGTALPIIGDASDPNTSVSNLQIGDNTFTWTISSALGACATTDDQVVVTRHALPAVLDPAPVLCEDLATPGDATVAAAYLASALITDGVTGIVGSAGRTVEFFADALRTIPVPDPLPVSNTDVVYTRVTRTDVTPNCQSEGIITFTVNPLPDAIPQDATNLETHYCESFPVGSGEADDVDLTVLEDDVTNNLANRSVTWYESDMTTLVVSPSDIDGVVDGRTFFALVENTITNCMKFAQVEIRVNSLPQDNPIETPGGTTPATYTVCAGFSTLLFQIDRDLNPGTTYIWSVPTGVGEFELFGGGTATDFYVLLEFPNEVPSPGLPITVFETSADGCMGAVNTLNIIVDDAPPAPVIAGDDNVCINEQNVPYNITAPVGGSTYTWTVPGTLGSIVSGQGDDEIIVNMSTTSGNISVVETNATGCVSPPALALSVTVNNKPSMTSPIAEELCSGAAVNSALVFTADIPGTVFDWEVVAKVGLVTGASVGNIGTGNIAQALTNTSGFLGQVIYDVTPKIDIDPTAGVEYCPGLPAQTVTIDVHPEPVGLIHSVTTCSDVPMNYDIQTQNIDALGNSLPSLFTYTVLSGNPGAVPAEPGRVVASDLPITHNYTNITTGIVVVTYTITPVSDDANACLGDPFNLTVNVRPEPAGGNDTDLVCSGDAINYPLLANVATDGNGLVAGTTFSWVAADNPNVTGESTAPVAGSLINNAITNTTIGNEVVVYTVTPISLLGCTGNSFDITVTVRPSPVGSNMTATVCSDEAVGVTLATAVGSVAAATYNITVNANGLVLSGGTDSNGNGKLANEIIDDEWNNPGINAVNVLYTIVPVSAAPESCEGNPFTVTVAVNPEPIGNAVAVTRCSDVALGVNLSSSMLAVPAMSFNISVNNNGLLQSGGTDSDGNGKAAGEIADDIWRNTGAASVNVVYTVTPVSGAGCEGADFTFTVTVHPEPEGGDITLLAQCSDVAFNLSADNVTNSVASTFTWVRNPLPGGLTQVVAGTGSGNIAETLQNLTASQLIATYVVTPASGTGCAGSTYVVGVPVNPEPVGASITRAVQCSDVPFNVSAANVTNGVLGSTFAWVRNALPAGLTVVTAGTGIGDIAETLHNLSAVQLNATYTVTPTSGANCVGSSYVVTVPVNPEPVGANVTRASQCSDVPFNVSASNITNGVTGTTFTWVRNALPAGLTVVTVGTGADAIAETLQNLSSSQLTATYVVTPTSGAGCVGSAYVVSVPVNPEPVGGNITRAAQCSDVAFSVTADNIGNSVTSTTFTWVRNALPAGLTLVTAGTGSGAIAETIQNLTGGQLTATYVVTPSALGCVGSAYVVSVPINPEPVAQALSTIQRCSGDPINFNIQSIISNVAPFTGGNGLVSKFRYTVIADFPLDLAPAVFPGVFDRAAATTLPISETFSNYSNHDVTLTYTITPLSNTNDCEGTEFTLQVVIHPEPVGQDVVDPVCSTVLNHDIQTQITNAGGLPSVFTYTVSSSDEISVPTPAGLDRVAASNANITDAFVNSSGGDVTVTYLITPFNTTHPSCAGIPFTYKVTISSKSVGVASVEAPVCSDELFSFDPQDNVDAGNSVASTFVWTATYDFPLTGPANGTGVINGSLNNTSNLQLFAHYVVTPTSGTCTGDPFTIDVPVNPEPVVDPALVTVPAVCSTNSASANPINVILNTDGTSIAAASFIIALKSQDAALVGTPTTGTFPANSPAAGLSDAITGDTYRNTTAAQLQVVYTVTPVSADGCVGNPLDVTVSINPEPVLDDPGAAPVCSSNADSASPINVVVGTDGVSVNAAGYQVNDIQYSDGGAFGAALPAGFSVVSQAAILGGFSSNNLIRNDRYNNTSSIAVTVRYSIQGRSTSGCLSEPLDYDVVISPEPIMIPGVANLCSGVPFGQNVSPAVGSATITEYELRGISIPNGLVAGGGNAGFGLHPADALGESNFLANDVFTNTTSGQLVVSYTIAPVANGCRGPDQIIQFTVNPAPALADNLGRTVCTDDAAAIVLSTNLASVTAASYEIISVTAGGTPIPAGSTVSGLTADAANASAGVTTDVNEIANDRFTNTTNNFLEVVYAVVPISGSACRGPEKLITLIIEPTILVVPTVASSSLCSNTQVNIALNSPSIPTAGTISYNYKVTASSGLVSGFLPIQTNLPNGHTVIDNLVNNSNTVETVTYTITPVAAGARNGNGCTGSSVDIVISVEPKPKVTVTPTTATVCEGAPLAFELTTETQPSVGVVTFQVVGNPVVSDPGVTGASPDGTIFNDGDMLDDILNNPTTTPQTVVYTLLPEALGVSCAGAAVQLTVTVHPLPVVTPASIFEQICSAGNINIALTYDVPGTIGIWTASPDANILGASAGAGSLLFQSLFNNSSTPGNVVYRITPMSPAGCLGAPVDVTVTVDPIPNVATTPALQTICDDGTTNIALTSAVAGATFDWTVTPSNPNLTGAADGTGNTITQAISNSGLFAGSVLYQVTPHGPAPTSCAGMPRPVVITVADRVGGTIFDDDAAICLGATRLLTFLPTGQAPFTMVYNDGTSDITIGNVGQNHQIQVSPSVTTTYELKSVTDVNGCQAVFAGETVTITVGDTDASFAIAGPTSDCSPFSAQFQYDQLAGTTYRWNWGDGNADSAYTATVNEPGKIIRHRYLNNSPVGTLNLDPKLTTSVDASLGGCIDTQTGHVSVGPTLTLAVFPDKTEICSGETVTFINQTLGAATHRWFYRMQGTTQEEEELTSIHASYTFTNTTSQNPIIYEVVYRADNGNCPEEGMIPITVYRGADAAFTEVIPPFIGGNSTVTFTNASVPIDGNDFTYEWDFGLNSDPATFDGTNTSINVNYSTPGLREVVLTVSNVVSAAAGVSCVDQATKTINILMPPLVANFSVSPKAGCFPIEVAVTENTSTGNTFKWQVIDQTGRIAATAEAPTPVFNIVNPGTYDIFLEATNTLTGQVAFAQVNGVEVYDNPVASIEARPTTLFIPDTELTTFNFTTGANLYMWDFGDGTTSEEFEPKHFYTLEGNYMITLFAGFDHGEKDTDGDGFLDGPVVCYDTATREVVARDGGLTKVPNAFTPSKNGPGGGNPGTGTFNDTFLPITKGVAQEDGAFVMQIYDRWGTLIFESRNQNMGWDGYDRNGNLVPAGVYVFKLDLRLANGQRTTQIGDVTLIR